MELLKVDSLNEAIDKLLNEYSKSHHSIGIETISLHDAFNRILACDIVSNKNIPSFCRSTVDGYACIAENTMGASDTIATFLEIVGESKMGEECKIELHYGECVYVPTGGMLPKNANCMVMMENTEIITPKKIAIYESSAVGKAVVKIGDDIKFNEIVLKKGHRLSYADMGVLASLAKYEIDVYKKWRITIISTGDELINENDEQNDFKINDVNTLLIEGLCKKFDIEIENKYICKDEVELLKDVLSSSMNESDVVVISGGSSKGKKDATALAINGLCSSKAITHGIAIKPGKPTITGYDSNTNTFVFGLPGHPVAASTLFELLVVEIYKKITNQKSVLENRHSCKGVLTSNLPASPGRKTIQLVYVDNEFNVTPIFARSGIVFSLAKATGYIVIEKDKEGLNKGDTVTVYYK